MMALTKEMVLALIAPLEGQQVELKRSLAELEEGVKSITAMANADGGHVIFGVRDDGTILGVQIGAQTKERVVQAITGNTDPISYPSVDYMDLDGKIVIVVSVEESDNKPHLWRGRACKRVGASNRFVAQQDRTRGGQSLWNSFSVYMTAAAATRRAIRGLTMATTARKASS